MISRLPLEVQVKLIYYDPSRSLKHANSHFYILYNDLYYDKIVSTFGEGIIEVIIKVLPWLKTYIKTLDVFRYTCRNIIASRLGLVDKPIGDEDKDNNEGDPNESNPLNSAFVKDSWKYIYSLLKNKRLFAEYCDYTIDEPTNYVFNHFVEINRTYLLSYAKSLWLAPGTYNLNIALVIKHGSGLGTTKFEVRYEDENNEQVIQTFYPPTNINDILPKKQFCFLKIGEFIIPSRKKHGKSEGGFRNKLRRVHLVMEEIGLYLKSGFKIFFIDISQPSLLFNDYDLLYYTVKETDYRYFINIPLKNLYKALNYVQSGGSSDGPTNECTTKNYGRGDPNSIWEQYDQDYLLDYTSRSDDEINDDENSCNANDDKKAIIEKRLHNYADLYFNNKFKKRYFKFNTVYQKRQFINKFGDYELDWNEFDEDSKAEKGNLNQTQISSSTRSCSYDREGLKWKIPIIGEL